MGRYYSNAKDIVENTTKLSIFRLKEFGLLCGYAATTLTWKSNLSGHKNSIGILVDTEKLHAKVNYTSTDRHSGEKTHYDYKINLTTTPCHFGGVRYWFICPLNVNGVYCGRRTGMLYLASGGHYFGCRHCYNLSYVSRNESRLGRFGQLGYLLKFVHNGKKTFAALILQALMNVFFYSYATLFRFHEICQQHNLAVISNGDRHSRSIQRRCKLLGKS